MNTSPRETSQDIRSNPIAYGIYFLTHHRRGDPSYKIAEDDRYYAFLDINPLTEGHTLVVPKKGGRLHLRPRRRNAVRTDPLRQKIAARIGRKIACKRVAVVVLGLEVPHTHIHLIPIKRRKKDVDFQREKLKLTPEEFAKIAETIAMQQ